MIETLATAINQNVAISHDHTTDQAILTVFGHTYTFTSQDDAITCFEILASMEML